MAAGVVVAPQPCPWLPRSTSGGHGPLRPPLAEPPSRRIPAARDELLSPRRERGRAVCRAEPQSRRVRPLQHSGAAVLQPAPSAPAQRAGGPPREEGPPHAGDGPGLGGGRRRRRGGRGRTPQAQVARDRGNLRGLPGTHRRYVGEGPRAVGKKVKGSGLDPSVWALPANHGTLRGGTDTAFLEHN